MTERNSLDWLTIDEVAELHRVSRRTVERWIANDTLAASKLPGGLVRIERAAAEGLLTPHAPATGSPPGGGGSLSSPEAT